MKAVSLLFLRFVDGHGVQDSVVGNVHGGEAADCFSRVLLTGKTKRQMTSGEGHGIEIFLKIIFCNIVTFKIRL